MKNEKNTCPWHPGSQASIAHPDFQVPSIRPFASLMPYSGTGRILQVKIKMWIRSRSLSRSQGARSCIQHSNIQQPAPSTPVPNTQYPASSTIAPPPLLPAIFAGLQYREPHPRSASVTTPWPVLPACKEIAPPMPGVCQPGKS